MFDPSHSQALHAKAEVLRSEFVIGIQGKVRRRPEGMVNKQLKSGTIEVVADSLEIYNTSDNIPFPIDGQVDVGEMTRLQYRYLDLRRHDLQKNFLIRHKVIGLIRRSAR